MPFCIYRLRARRHDDHQNRTDVILEFCTAREVESGKEVLRLFVSNKKPKPADVFMLSSYLEAGRPSFYTLHSTYTFFRGLRVGLRICICILVSLFFVFRSYLTYTHGHILA